MASIFTTFGVPRPVTGSTRTVSVAPPRRTTKARLTPTRNRSETLRTATLVRAAGDIIEHARVRVERRVQEAQRRASDLRPVLVDDGDDGREGRAGAAGAVDELVAAVEGDEVVCTVCGDVGVGSGVAGGIVDGGAVAGIVVCQVFGDGGGLVGWHAELVGEATAGIDYGLAGFFGLRCEDGGIVLDLCRADYKKLSNHC